MEDDNRDQVKAEDETQKNHQTISKPGLFFLMNKTITRFVNKQKKSSNEYNQVMGGYTLKHMQIIFHGSRIMNTAMHIN